MAVIIGVICQVRAYPKVSSAATLGVGSVFLAGDTRRSCG